MSGIRTTGTALITSVQPQAQKKEAAMLTDTPNSIAARIGEFIRSEAQQQASVPEPLTAEQLHPENALMPIAMPSIDDFAADYRSCLQKFSERERAALDHVIQALSSVPR